MRRYNGKCKRCKRRASVLAHDMRQLFRGPDGDWWNLYVDEAGCPLKFNNGRIVVWCACGHFVKCEPVRGRFKADHKCDARCLNAKGHSCECACGGKNHGAGYELQPSL